MKRSGIRLAFVVIWIGMTAGCSAPFVENNTIEEIAPVIFWSIREGGNDELIVSTVAPPLVKEQKRLLSFHVRLLKESGEKFNLSYFRELKHGQLRMLFIDRKVAERGVAPIINTLYANPEISERLYLAVVEGNFEEYMRAQLEKQPELDFFLYRMFRHYERKRQGEQTVVNMHEYMKSVHHPILDPVMPVFKTDKENFVYEGTAVFKKDQLAGILRGTEERILQLVANDHYIKFLPMPELGVSIGKVRAHVRTKLDRKLDSVSLRVSLQGKIEEYRGPLDLLARRQHEALERKIENYLNERTVDLLRQMQSWKADPLKLGLHTLSPWKQPLREKQWVELWGNMKIKAEYRVNLDTLISSAGP